MVTCGSCDYFFKLQNQCRRYPPTVPASMVIVNGTQIQVQAVTAWPETKEGEKGCGEYKASLVLESR